MHPDLEKTTYVIKEFHKPFFANDILESDGISLPLSVSSNFVFSRAPGFSFQLVLASVSDQRS